MSPLDAGTFERFRRLDDLFRTAPCFRNHLVLVSLGLVGGSHLVLTRLENIVEGGLHFGGGLHFLKLNADDVDAGLVSVKNLLKLCPGVYLQVYAFFGQNLAQ